MKLLCSAWSEVLEVFILTITTCDDERDARPEKGIGPISRSGALPGPIVILSKDVVEVLGLLKV
jgi:hypothetical protein